MPVDHNLISHVRLVTSCYIMLHHTNWKSVGDIFGQSLWSFQLLQLPMVLLAEAQRHSIPFKEELNGLLSTLSDTGDTIERWFKASGCRALASSLMGKISGNNSGKFH